MASIKGKDLPPDQDVNFLGAQRGYAAEPISSGDIVYISGTIPGGTGLMFSLAPEEEDALGPLYVAGHDATPRDRSSDGRLIARQWRILTDQDVSKAKSLLLYSGKEPGSYTVSDKGTYVVGKILDKGAGVIWLAPTPRWPNRSATPPYA